ncbi:MAG TPA: DUF1800 domain-containing protein [Chloroflexota bacterium]|nr:DUF1800 domain-containing protein [Chloroflexota bacterium]
MLFARAGVALQAILFAASCGYGRTEPEPLRGRRAQLSHLLRRAAFGADPATLDEYERLGLNGAVERLLDVSDGEEDLDKRLVGLGLDRRKLGDLQRWWLLRMAYTQHPLREKMILFWHGLLTSGSAKVGLPNPTPQNPNPPHYLLDQHTFFRAHALDTYGSILSGIARDPAMMIWLDAQTNNKNRPNENFARELMELFTIGADGFAETDVREVARAFTGRALDNGRYVFRPTNFDTGIKTVLGKSGAFKGDDVLELLAAHPRTAERLARRLWSHFAFPNPTERDVRPLVAAYVRTNGSVAEMLRVMFKSPEFYSPRAYRSLVKGPVDYVVGMIRSFKVTVGGANLPGVTTRMGQALFNPPNVAGWPGGVNWLNTTTWVERVNFANHVVTARNDTNTMAPQLSLMLEREGLRTPEQVVEYFGAFLLDGQMSAHLRQTVLAYLKGGSGEASPALIGGAKNRSFSPAFVDQRVRGLVYLILASPEYQLA